MLLAFIKQYINYKSGQPSTFAQLLHESLLVSAFDEHLAKEELREAELLVGGGLTKGFVLGAASEVSAGGGHKVKIVGTFRGVLEALCTDKGVQIDLLRLVAPSGTTYR